MIANHLPCDLIAMVEIKIEYFNYCLAPAIILCLVVHYSQKNWVYINNSKEIPYYTADQNHSEKNLQTWCSNSAQNRTRSLFPWKNKGAKISYRYLKPFRNGYSRKKCWKLKKSLFSGGWWHDGHRIESCVHGSWLIQNNYFSKNK